MLSVPSALLTLFMVFCNQKRQIKKCPAEDFVFQQSVQGIQAFPLKFSCHGLAGAAWQATWPNFLLHAQGQSPTPAPKATQQLLERLWPPLELDLGERSL